jgi:hypothetical protein
MAAAVSASARAGLRPRVRPLPPSCSCKWHHHPPASHYAIFGERDSGTNMVEQLMRVNFKVNQSEEFGFKHMYESEWKIMRGAAAAGLSHAHIGVVLVVRRSSSWLMAMFDNCHECKLMTRNRTFAQFLHATPWVSSGNAPRLTNRPAGAAYVRWLAAHGGRHGYPSYANHELYANIFALRRSKLQASSHILVPVCGGSRACSRPRKTKHYSAGRPCLASPGHASGNG